MPTPRKTDAEHALQGTRPQVKEAEGSAAAPGRPKFPKGLSHDARVVFKRIVRLLEKRRHITEGDVELIRLYALLYIRHTKALAKLEAEGEVKIYVRMDSNGQPHDQEKPNLWLKIAETAERNMVACLDRLGLTPHNRAKVKPTGKPETAKPSEFEEFLSRNKGAGWVMPAVEEENHAGRTDFEA